MTLLLPALLASLTACDAPVAPVTVTTLPDDELPAGDGGGSDGGDDGSSDDGSDGGDDGSSDDGSDGGDDTAPPDGETETNPSARADLRLKRWRQVALDLEGALALPPEEICRETGLYDCAVFHAVAMGGISVDNGVFEHSNELSATTGLALERMAMQACYNRMVLDASGEEGAPVVFSHVDLASDALSAGEAEAQIAELTRRLLARDPLPAELEALTGLHDDAVAEGGGNADWAVLTCFALATSTEALTY
jgi:hypothetical protein